MNVLKNFCHRGAIFAGFGPVVTAIVILCISYRTPVALTAKEFLTATVSTYLLAFIQAGATVFEQVESWSVVKSATLHCLSLYVAYISCYLVNRWIPFNPKVILFFTLVFVAVFLIIWITAYLVARKTTNRLNDNLNHK